MIKVFGCSDDLLEFEGDYCEEVDCFDEIADVGFTDGTVIRAEYGKNGKAIWKIEVLAAGTMPYSLQECEDEDATPYSDVFITEADFSWCKKAEGEE